MKIEKCKGPYIGPDTELARACAMAVIPDYGSDDAVTHARILKNGIWNDHVAVQAALTAIQHLRKQAEGPPRTERGESTGPKPPAATQEDDDSYTFDRLLGPKDGI